MPKRPDPPAGPLSQEEIDWWLNEVNQHEGIRSNLRSVISRGLTEVVELRVREAELQHLAGRGWAPMRDRWRLDLDRWRDRSVLAKLRPRNVAAGIAGQSWRTFLLTGDGWGIFHRRSHFNASGKPKVEHPTKEAADKAVVSMLRRYPDAEFESYKCIFCPSYHIGRNR